MQGVLEEAEADFDRDIILTGCQSMMDEIKHMRHHLVVADTLGRTRELMPCGHPRACVVSADDDRDSTGHCAWCTDLARWRGLLEIAADNAEGFREMLVECEREAAELKADAKLSATRAAMVSEMGWDAEVEIAELKAELARRDIMIRQGETELALVQSKASSRGERL